ncbi:MAG: hypothetical protein HFI08_02590 [Bacilli bacterium]|nr:hypothetical protein [Bacilli bacterium]
MREAIGGTWLFQIVIVFILLFTGYMCLSINHSKAYNVKSEILEIIERYNGIDLSQDINGEDMALLEIVNNMQVNSYRTTGKCPSDLTDADHNVVGHYVGYNREGKFDSTNPTLCIAKVDVGSKENTNQVVQELPSMSYYRVVVFYQLDLPIFQDLFMFSLKGDTKILSISR